MIFMIILLLFGAKRLPELFRSFGKSLKEFKKATSDIEEDFRDAMNTEGDSKPQRSSGGSQAAKKDQSNSVQQSIPDEDTAESATVETGKEKI